MTKIVLGALIGALIMLTALTFLMLPFAVYRVAFGDF